MSKELEEALKYVNGKIADLEDDLQHYTMVDKNKCKEFYIREDLKEFTNIKQALQRLESIDNSNPSEVLDLFNQWKDNIEYGVVYIPYFVINEVELALIKAQKQEKVLNVILKKQVDINEIKIMISNLKHCDDIERCKRYNASRKVGYKLKQDEFNSIKEMLKCN